MVINMLQKGVNPMNLRQKVLKKLDKKERKYQADTIREYRKLVKELIRALKKRG